MIPVLRQELRQRKWYIFWWTVGLAAYMALVIGVYPAFHAQAGQLSNSLNKLPATVKSFISDTNNLFSPVGYMSANVYYLLLPILYGVLTIGLGSSLLARDEQNHTIELLLSRPVSRARVLAAKALAGVVILAVVTAAGTIVSALFFGWLAHLGIGAGPLALATVVAAALALVFGALALLFTALGSGARVAAIGVSTLLLVASYLFTSLSGTVHWLRWPAKLLPYNYYHPAAIMNGNFGAHDFIGMAIASVVLGALAVVAFRRRDIE